MVYLNKKITRELDMYGILSLLTYLFLNAEVTKRPFILVCNFSRNVCLFHIVQY